MPRQMPPLARRFGIAASVAVGIAEAGEVIRANAAKGSVARVELRVARLEALHEMAYLRVFVEWELFLEAVFLRYQCGYFSPFYTPVFIGGEQRQSTLAQALSSLSGTQHYLLWHNPSRTVARAQQWFDQSPLELVTLSNLNRLESFAAIRHGIAHGSPDIRRKVDIATQALSGRSYPGAVCGRFLRDWDSSVRPPRRWLISIASELQNLAAQISP